VPRSARRREREHGDDGPARPGHAGRAERRWRSSSIDLSAFAGRTIRLRFLGDGRRNNGIVEAGFDDVRVTQPQ
jgi:hypothetical protein